MDLPLTTAPEPPATLLRDLWRYLRAPVHAPPLSLPPATAAWWAVRAWALAFWVSLGLGVCLGVLLLALGQTPADNAVTALVSDLPMALALLLGAVAAPLVEEATFRLWLRYSRPAFAVSAALALLLAAPPAAEALALPVPAWLFRIGQPEGLASLAAGLAVLAAAIWVGLARFGEAPLRRLFDRHFRLIFYGAAGAFALLHLGNYTRLAEIWFLAPLLVLPQFLLGVMLGYVRMRLGFVWCTGIHMLHNAIILIPVLVLAHFVE